MAHVSKSLQILREEGPMTLADLTNKTAKALGVNCYYRDVHATMEAHLQDGEAEVNDAGRDYRQHEWKAIV